MSKRLTIEEYNRIAYAKIKLKELLDSPNCIELIRQNPNYDYMMHVIAHRDAFARLEAHTVYHGRFSPSHDIEKVGLGLVLGRETTKYIHKKTAPHHNVDWYNPNFDILTEKVFDWESCHYTKLKSPETAYDYVGLAYPDKLQLLKPILSELGLWDKHNVNPLQPEQYEKIVSSIHDEHILAELRKSYAYICENF